MAETRQYDFGALSFAPDLEIGCLRVRHADRLSLLEAFAAVDEDEVSLTLTADNPEPWDDLTMASFRMFRLPGGRKELERVVKWFGEKRKTRAKLPDGIPFEASTLAIRDIHGDWQHEAFPRSGRDLIHIYQTGEYGVLIRLMGKSGTLLDNPLLRHLQENARLEEGLWADRLPTVVEKEAAQVEAVPLPEDVRQEVRAAAARARAALHLNPTAAPEQWAGAVHQAVEQARKRKGVSAEERRRLAVDYGSLWGEALCAAAGWEWRCVLLGPEQALYAVCSRDGSHAVDPISMIHENLDPKRPDPSSLLLFNMIREGAMPASTAGRYCWLS